MSKNKYDSKSGENQEETKNPRREFMGKAAMIAAGVAVGTIAGGKQLLGQDKTVGLNKEGLVMLKDGKVYNGPGLFDHLGLDYPAAKKGCTEFCIIKIECRKRFNIGLSVAKPVNVNLGGGKTKQIKNCPTLIFPSSQSVINRLKKRGLIASKKEEIKNIRKGRKNIRKGK